LAKLYGGQYKPQIQYPTLKKKKKKGPMHSSGWHPTGKANNADPRRSHVDKSKALSVSVPKFQKKSQYTFAPVDFIPKRRAVEECRQFIDDVEMRQSAYRPPNVNAYSAESEKDRLSEVFTHKGGRALPNELTHPVGPAPSEVRQKMAEQRRIDEARSIRRARLNGGVDPLAKEEVPVAVDERSHKDMMFDQIQGEIMDRRNHQEAMEAAGGGKDTRSKTAAEISSRLSKLSVLDPGRAAELIVELYDNK